MRRNNDLWTINQQGALEFDLRKRQSARKYQSDSLWEHSVAAVIIMTVCATLDFVMFKQLYASMLYEHELIQWASILGTLIIFDCGPIYLGLVLKKRKQGYNIEKMIPILLILAFSLAAIGNVILRIIMKDVILPPSQDTADSLFGPLAEEETSNPGALPYAIFSAFLPVVTSIVSFSISYIVSDPLKKKLKCLHADQIELEDAIGWIEATVKEYEEDRDLEGRLLKDDNEKYEACLGMTREKAIAYCNYVRERLKEHLGDPASSNELSKDCRQGLVDLFNETGETERK